MNKQRRRELAALRATKLAVRLGWRQDFADLPAETRIALLSRGSIRISRRSDRKCFSKDVYGQRTGYAPYLHLDPKALRDRCRSREETE